MKILQTISSRILFIRLLTWISTKNTPWSLHREPQPLNQSRLTGFRSAPSGTECARQIPVSSLNRIDHLTASSSSPRVHERIQLNACFIYIYISNRNNPSYYRWGAKFLRKIEKRGWKHGRRRKEREEKSRNAAAAVAPVALYFRSQLGNAATISRGR